MTLRAELNGKNDILGLLGSIPLFSGLAEQDLLLIQNHAAIKSYRKNTVVIEQGDESTSLYIVAKGRVRVYLANEDGKELLLHNLGPGDYFGELALLGGIPRTASVMTETDTRLLVVTKQGFVECVRSNPDIALETIRQLVDKLSQLTEKTGVLALNDVYGRVVATLMDQVKEEGDRLITGRLTQQDLAQMVGSSREMISRIFKDLKAGGYISLENKRVVIEKRLPSHW